MKLLGGPRTPSTFSCVIPILTMPCGVQTFASRHRIHISKAEKAISVKPIKTIIHFSLRFFIVGSSIVNIDFSFGLRVCSRRGGGEWLESRLEPVFGCQPAQAVSPLSGRGLPRGRLPPRNRTCASRRIRLD